MNPYEQSYEKAKLAKMNEKFRNQTSIDWQMVFYLVSLLAIVIISSI